MMRDLIRNILAIAVAFAVLCIPAAIIRISYEIAFIGAGPAIEQLRSDIKNISSVASEDVVGQATNFNQRIRTMQAYNARWWGDPFIPDEWDSIELLPIPRIYSENDSRQEYAKVRLPQNEDNAPTK